MNTLWKLTAREMTRRPGRTLLTLGGIVIGVASVVAVTSTIVATRKAYRDMFTAIGGRAALEIVATGPGGFEAEPLRALASRVDGVKAAVGIIQGRIDLIQTGIRHRVLMLGIDPQQSESAHTYQLRAGRTLQNPGEILLEAGFAARHGLALGDQTLLGTEKVTVVGLLEPEGLSLFTGGSLVLVPLPTAQKLEGLPGRVNALQLILHDGADPQKVQQTLAGVLPPGFEVQSPMARTELAQHGLLSTEQGLSTLSVVSLVAGGVIILNSFLMNLTERRKQLAILRALGTTRSQVQGLLLREALLLGFTGAVLGIGVGYALAQVTVQAQEKLVGVEIAVPFSRQATIQALVLGPGMAWLATWMPARQASRRSPLEAMLPRRGSAEETVRRWPAYLGLTMMVAGLTVVAGMVGRWWPPAVSTALLPPLMVLVLVSCVLVLPLLQEPLAALAGRLLRPILGVEGTLALRQLQRQRSRTGLTVGVLFISVITTIGFANSSLNNIRDIDVWYRDTIPCDYLIRKGMLDTGLPAGPSMAPRLEAELQRLNVDVGKISFVLDVRLLEDKRRALLLARSTPLDRPLPLALIEGKPDEARRGLAAGGVALGTTLAQRAGLKRGDSLTIHTRQGPVEVPVVAVVKEYTSGGMAFYMDWDRAAALFDIRVVHAFEVYSKDGQAAQVEPALREFCSRHGLLLQSNTDLRRMIDQAVAAVMAFLWLLILLTFVVASLGVINTLTMNVHEQTREIGVLRAIGLKRGQVFKVVMAQALAMGILSVLPGMGVGILVAWLMNLATHPLSGHQPEFVLLWPVVFGCALGALVIAVLAACVPARRASRIQVLHALHYE